MHGCGTPRRHCLRISASQLAMPRSSWVTRTSRPRSRSTPTSMKSPAAMPWPGSTSCSAAPNDPGTVVNLGGQRRFPRSPRLRLAWGAQLDSNQCPLARKDCHHQSPDLRLIRSAQVSSEQERAQPSTTKPPRANALPSALPLHDCFCRSGSRACTERRSADHPVLCGRRRPGGEGRDSASVSRRGVGARGLRVPGLPGSGRSLPRSLARAPTIGVLAHYRLSR